MNINSLVGLFTEDAKAQCKEEGLAVRVTNIDNESLFVTEEIDPMRINLTINQGVVTYVTLG